MRSPTKTLLLAAALLAGAALLFARLRGGGEDPPSAAGAAATPSSGAGRPHEVADAGERMDPLDAPPAGRELQGGNGDAGGPAAPGAEESTSVEDLGADDARWERKYEGMSADQLEAERVRLHLLYTDEMSALTWPMFRSKDCRWADASAGQAPPPSKPGALVVVGSPEGRRTPYVVVTEDQAPRLHEWMDEIAWLLEETERRREAAGGG